MSTIEVIINGVTQKVTKNELFDLAAKGSINPQTPIMVDGKIATAGKVKGIIFLLPQEELEFIDGSGALVPTNHVTYGSDYGGSYNSYQNTPNLPPPVYPGNVGPYGVPSTVYPPAYAQHPFPNANSSGIGNSVTSLVLGILGMFAWFIPIIGAPVTIIGLVCGCLGVSREGRGMATAGIVLCIIGLILTVINFFLGMLIVLEEMGKL